MTRATASPLSATRALLADGRPIDAVEAALVAAWCAAHGLTPTPGGAVHAAVSAANPQLTAAFSAVEAWEVDGVVMAFETLVPANEAARYGAVFTPAPVTAFLVSEAVHRWSATNPGRDLADVTVLDPTVGAGAILAAALTQLTAATGQRPHEVANRLHGVDISPGSVRRARTLLELMCLTLGDPVIPAPHLTVGDALTVAHERRFDLVVGNPPYVRYQQLPVDERARLARLFPAVCGSGNFNLYFPFFPLAYAAAADGGQVALITPNSWLGGFAASGLRSWMKTADAVRDIVDFGHHRVFDAMTYTAVTFLAAPEAREEGELRYADVAGLPDLATLPANWATSRTQTYHVSDLPDGKPWRLAGPSAAAALAALSAHTPLTALADIRYGVTTNLNDVYLLDGARNPDGTYIKVRDGVTYALEAGITRRCVKVAGLTSQAQLDTDQTRIVYPYELTDAGPVILDEATLQNLYPNAYAYLTACRDELADRDKGKKTYAAWYAYARTQSLAPLGTTLLTPMYAKTPRFLRDDDPDSLFINGVAIAPRQISADVLGWFLNSSACRFYVTHTSTPINGGYFAYQKPQIGSFTIPELTNDQIAALREAGTSQERDALIAAAYGLTLEQLTPPAGNEDEQA